MSLGMGASYNLLTVVQMSITCPADGGPNIVRYQAECLCGRKFWCTEKRFMEGVEVNQRMGRRVHQCSRKCTY
jgi:hypothetical protein